jgi:sodium/bile acid cotransporter 7
MNAFLAKHWFTLCIPLVVVLGWGFPDLMRSGGLLHAEVWKDWLVVGIFLLSGLGLAGKALVTAAANWRLHLFVQVFSLAVIPLLFWLLKPALIAAGLAEPLVMGLLFMACLPTTIAGCVAVTRAGDGDVAAALFNSAGGNLLGIVVTPLTCLLLTGLHTAVPVREVMLQLFWLAVVPIAVGQGLRLVAARRIEPHSALFGKVTQVLLLGILANVFATSFHKGFPSVGAWSLALLGLVVVVGHLGLLWLSWRLSRLPALGLAPAGRIAALFCSTQKTAALGVPMLSVMFAGDARLGLLTLPILCYHPLQITLAAVLAARLKTWKTRASA